MAAHDPHAPEEVKFRREFLIAAAVLAAPLAAILIANPDIDLAISQAAREACSVPATVPGRPWCPTDAMDFARRIFMAIFALVSIAAVITALRVVVARRKWIGLEQARCGFLIAVLVMGPGVVANLVLKDNLGRARPRDVIEFGGDKAFTPALVPSEECPRNCSFISGEASSMFAAFFALALVLPQYRRGLLAAGVLVGLLAGAVRILQGAHFFSDVLFAGVFMALTVSVLHIAIIGIWRDPRRTWVLLSAPFTPLVRVAMVGRTR
ncbi:phosphatase PAP2 family protein [Hyphomicrobium sp. CS1GBMeth3]|uniref:phosphatase PAP2 family protein n=1 Tax=Hyphomicrobium sp. CS1GBMeth3 TaxID=1892845 RepID=UPI0009310B47|nr:phosphatase PAP2 family protein [Hyphomicrobium sp. CS1GBMeth3]